MKKLDKRLIRLIKNSKGQYIAIITVLLVGIMIYTALSIASTNLVSTLDDYYTENNFADIFVQLLRIHEGSIEKLESEPQIKQAQGRHVLEAPVLTNQTDERVMIRIISIPDREHIINDFHIVKGKLIDASSEKIMVLEQFAKARGINIGDNISYQHNGHRYQNEVAAIVANPEFVYLMENEQSFLPTPEKYGVIYVSDMFASDNLGLGKNYNELVLTLNEGVDPGQYKDVLEDKLENFGVMRIFTQENQLSNRMVHEEINGLEQSSQAVPFIFLGVAAVILAVMLRRMVKTDRIAIGILKAMGYTNNDIVMHYVKYALSIAIIGGVLGLVLGFSISGLMTRMYVEFFNIPLLKVTIYTRYIVLSLFLSSFFCIISGLWGAKDILKISPAESMRAPVPQAGKRILLEKWQKFWKKITFSWKIVIRNTFRSKKRFLFIAFGVALTYAVLLFSVFMGDIFDAMLVEHYGNFQKMDYTVDFNKPISISALSDFKDIVGTGEIEPRSEYPFEFVSGRQSQIANIIGLVPNSQFYTFTDLDENNFTMPDKGLVVSENLSRKLNLDIGDSVIIKSFLPERADQKVRITAITKQLFGINAYMPIERMNSLLLDEGAMTGAYIKGGNDLLSEIKNIPVVSNILSLNEIINAFREFIGLIIISIGFMVIMGGVLGFAIIFTATSMNISERTREFSSLRVMGFSKGEIYSIVTKENFLMSISGILMGIPLGNIFLDSIDKAFSNDLYTLNLTPDLSSYFLAAIVTIAFIVLAQLATKKKIDKLDFLEALKNRVV